MNTFDNKMLEEAYGHYSQQKIKEAKEICDQLIKKNNKNEKLLNLMGLIQYSLNNLVESEKYISQAISINPQSCELLNNLGFVLMAQKKFIESEVIFKKILEIDEVNITATNNLAHVLLKLGNYKESILKLEKLTFLEKKNKSHIFWLGYAYLKLEDYQNAKKLFKNYLINNPKDTNALINLSYIFQIEKNYTEASSQLHLILSYDEKNSQAYNNLGLIYKEQSNFYKAIFYLIKSIKIDKKNFNAYINLGIVLQDKKKFLFAKRIFENATTLRPYDKFVMGRLLNIKNIISDWNNNEKIKKNIKDLILDNKEATPSFVCLSNFDDEELHLKSAKKWSENFKAINIDILKKKIKKNKLSVGFFSADFRNHAMGYILANLFEKLNHDLFDYHAFYLGPKNETSTKKRIKQSFKNFYEIQDYNKIQRYHFIKDLNLDIAIDLTGYTQHSFTDLFASKIANIKINYLGYPGSLGLGHFDYIIADKIVIPQNNQINYLEKILYLDHCYQPNDKFRFENLKKIEKKELGIPLDKFIFGNFNNSFKITKEVFDIWLNLLENNENSILILLESNSLQKQNILDYARKKKLEKKIFFTTRSDQKIHLSKHKLVDLFLDTFPYNGHVSASDALLTGIPYLALQGKSFQSRVSSSILNELKLNELVSHNFKDYYEKALELSINKKKYSELKFKLKKNIKNSELLNMQKFAKNIENIFLKISK